jgi:VanZ family protein
MKTFRRFFWFVPTIIWMVVIFQFSSQEGVQSASISRKVTEYAAKLLHETVLQDRDYEVIVEVLHPAVRKTAHMAEYAILYVLLFLSFFFSMLATRSAAVSIVIAFIYAIIDETHQTFVSGRSGQFYDVCVDMTGVLIAVCIVLFAYSFWQGHHLRKEELAKEQQEMETDERLRQARIEGARFERERLRQEMAASGSLPFQEERAEEEPESRLFKFMKKKRGDNK